jgi:serine/threonine-protein kinase
MDIEQLAGTILGNYEIKPLLDRGGLDEVYKARQISLTCLVALKILPPSFSSDCSSVKRFHRETEAVLCLHHHNIVQIHLTVLLEGSLLSIFDLLSVEE